MDGKTDAVLALSNAFTVSITINIKQFCMQTKLTHTHPVSHTHTHTHTHTHRLRHTYSLCAHSCPHKFIFAALSKSITFQHSVFQSAVSLLLPL